MSETSILFVNHASLLIRHGDKYLLTDPWFERPAFGSWLPSYPPAVHPVYLAALENLSILISHGHDDHCDDQFLKLFNKDTPILSAFPWVGKRAMESGLNDFRIVDPEMPISGGPFTIKSYPCGPADAIYTIETPDALVIHANDNWDMPGEALKAIKQDVKRIGRERTLYLSQVGSASGWPLNYRCYSDEEKQSLLKDKVIKMACAASGNAIGLGLPIGGYAAYAGYALPFVEGKDYISQGFNPTPENIAKDTLFHNPIDFLPGDIYDFETPIRRAFTGNRGNVAKKAEQFYRLYEKVPIGEWWRHGFDKHTIDDLRRDLSAFLTEFELFARKSVVPGRLFDICYSLPDGSAEHATIRFGEGIVASSAYGMANKTLYVSAHLLKRVLTGELLFESLYTGYLGEWERHPKDVHNEDIIDAIVAFSYVWMDKVKKAAA